MRFNQHSELEDKHAFLSPSGYHWLNYDDLKLEARFTSAQAARRGSELHKLAHMCITLGVKLAKSNYALASYVNDAIGYKMASEQALYYSDNCFGTADAISFRRNKLRVHDLKTGLTRTSERQLEVYAALFCLEYEQSPYEMSIELRIYQGDEVKVFEPPPEAIENIMAIIVEHDRKIEEFRRQQNL
jgi:hypothetical protein